jgi:hypothetical protein
LALQAATAALAKVGRYWNERHGARQVQYLLLDEMLEEEDFRLWF